ncbi:MAG: 3-hydroxylacyl-ACP dehydratase [Gammaproteobacteria bacterium]
MTEPLPAVAELLPHTGSAILVDELRAETADGVIAIARIGRAHALFAPQQHGVPSWVGIELMAQAIALHAGLLARRGSGRPRVGYLLGTRRYAPSVANFARGLELEIRAERSYLDDSGLGAYDCSIVSNGSALASATLTVFQTEEEVGR